MPVVDDQLGHHTYILYWLVDMLVKSLRILLSFPHHLFRLTPVLVSLREFAVCPLELRSVFHSFPARRSAGIHGDTFVSFR